LPGVGKVCYPVAESACGEYVDENQGFTRLNKYGASASAT